MARSVAGLIADVEVEGVVHEVIFGEPSQAAACDWLRFHGVDPNRVLAGTLVWRDGPGRRIIVHEYIVLNEDGKAELTSDGLDVVTTRLVEQGEAPPLPLPAEVTRGKGS